MNISCKIQKKKVVYLDCVSDDEESVGKPPKLHLLPKWCHVEVKDESDATFLRWSFTLLFPADWGSLFKFGSSLTFNKRSLLVLILLLTVLVRLPQTEEGFL